jgi:hypothetical protein
LTSQNGLFIVGAQTPNDNRVDTEHNAILSAGNLIIKIVINFVSMHRKNVNNSSNIVGKIIHFRPSVCVHKPKAIIASLP